MNQYHIYEVIGRGKHSNVYKGRKKKTIEYYAIKSIEKAQKNRVLQEVRILHSLDHPNILKFYAWYETSAHLWLVLEYCVGGDLLTLLRQDAKLPEESVHDFAYDLAQALQYLHSKGVIYCDLKPSNVLLDQNGQLKLCDFGLARRVSDISKSSTQQLPEARRGTPCYMAPELFQDGVHSFSSDLWALGCVLYECFSGRPPFVSNSFTQLVQSILFDPLPAFSCQPCKELEDLIHRLLAKDPLKRIQWPELCQHPFWKVKVAALPLPPQPAFVRFGPKPSSPLSSELASKNVAMSDAKHTRGRSQKPDQLHGKMAARKVLQRKQLVSHVTDPGAVENISKPNAQSNHRKGGGTKVAVNLLRLSKIVKTNLQREIDGGNYRRPLASTPMNDADDVSIANNDMELNFSERTEDEGNDEDGSFAFDVSNEHPANEKEAFKDTPEKILPELRTPNHKHLTRNTGNRGGELQKAVENETSRLENVRLEVFTTPVGAGLPRKAQRIFSTGGPKKTPRSSSPLSNGEAPLKISDVLSNALWHPSDLSVRPIMSTRKNVDPAFDQKMLHVDNISSFDFVKLPSQQQERFIHKLIASITGGTSLIDKLNTLKYVESLSVNVDVANILVNGALMAMLVKLLRTSKLPALRVQVASVMGFLIRHATLIEEELASIGIVAVLTEGLRDNQDKVRRYSMAGLGELLFYIASQSDQSSPRLALGGESPAKTNKSSSAWQIPNTSIALIASSLCKGEDSVMQHYALKTIENVSSQGGDWAARFTTHEVIDNLCYIFKYPAKQDYFRATAGSCLVRLLRFNPVSISQLVDKLTVKDFIATISKRNPKEQQIILNLVMLPLLGNNFTHISKYLNSLLEEKGFTPSLVSMLEQGTDVLPGKVVVCAALLCKATPRFLPALCNAKLLSAVERLSKEKEPYIQRCVEALVDAITSAIPGLLDNISAEIRQTSNQKSLHSLKGSFQWLSIVLYFLNSPVFRPRIVNEQILKQLSEFMKHLETGTAQGQIDFQSNLLKILEVFSQQVSIPLGYPKIFTSHILPILATLYKRNSSDGNTRFLCLKIFYDVLIVFLDDVSKSHTTSTTNTTTKDDIAKPRVEDFRLLAKQHFLPLYPSLIEDEDPIPMYAQKLLMMLLDVRCIEIKDILSLKLVSHFFDFLKQDIGSINLHCLRLCLSLASAAEVETSVLSELKATKRIGDLLRFVHEKGMEDFLEPALCLCCCFLRRQVGGNEEIASFSRHTRVFLDLLASQEPQIAKAAVECLHLLATRFPLQLATQIFPHIKHIGRALDSFAAFPTTRIASQLQEQLLKVLYLVCKEAMHHQLPISKIAMADIQAIQLKVQRLKDSSSVYVSQAASDAALQLECLCCWNSSLE